MTARARFSQGDVERIMRASKKLGVPVEFDLVSGKATILTPDRVSPVLSAAVDDDDGFEQWKKDRGLD